MLFMPPTKFDSIFLFVDGDDDEACVCVVGILDVFVLVLVKLVEGGGGGVRDLTSGLPVLFVVVVVVVASGVFEFPSKLKPLLLLFTL